jgi:hypothetical protein
MSPELQAFKRELDDAGQPWSRLGVRGVGVGLVGLLIVQLSFGAGKVAIWLTDWLPNAFFVLTGLAVAMIAAGWVLLIVAFVKRRRWEKAHVFEPPSLADTPISTP